MNLEELRARLGTPSPPPVGIGGKPNSTPIERCVPGQEIQGPEGRCFVVDSVRGATQSHGRHEIGSLTHAGRLRLPVLSGQPRHVEVNLQSTAFIDTETTGLGYGVGTHVFMVGVGHIEDGVFRVRQYFLRHPNEEKAMLASLGEYLDRFDSVVSYNGRAFDWPLLANRFVYQRIVMMHTEPVHIDLLYVARRFWKLRVDSCSLGSIEHKVLGVARSHDDVEGWMIPQLYFQYIRSGNARPLRRIFYHNLQDILSLAMLSLHVDRVMEDPWCGLVEHPIDYFSLGRVYGVMSDPDMAMRCINCALDSGLPPRLEAEACLRLALIQKRRQNWSAALPLFERVLDRPGFQRIACIELAKYQEHVARDHGQAMSFTVRAIRSSDYPPATSWPGTSHMELLHRRRRLIRRLEGDSAFAY